MATKLELMLEAENRGILPPDKAAVLNEARRRGLINDVEEKDLFGRISEDLQVRERKIQESKQARIKREIGPVRAGYQQGGQAALGVLDVTGEAIVSGFRALPDAIEEPIRKGAAGILTTVGKLPAYGGGSIGEKIPEELGVLSRKYQGFAKENPNLARDLEATLGYGALLSPTKTKVKTREPFFTLDKAGQKLTRSGEKQARAKN